jgi:hypothetical protein
MTALLRDLRLAVRILLRTKSWTLVVLLSLALGIGANTALFTAVNGLLLQTVRVHEPERLVRFSSAGKNDMVRSSSDYGYSGPSGAARSYDAEWRPEADAVAWMAVRSLFENRAHMLRAMITSWLGISIFDQAKSADVPYSQVRRKAARLWPLWL